MLHIQMQLYDRDGLPIELGDWVELFDWGASKKSLGLTKITWDHSSGRVRGEPDIVEDPYDFFSKALPRCRRMIVVEEE